LVRASLAALLALVGAAPSCKSSNGQGTTSAPLCTASAPGPAPLRRLTRFEIARSLADVMGTDPALVDDLPPDEESDGYDNSAAAYSVSPLHAQKLLDLGEAAAAALVADSARLRAFAACDPTADGAGCTSAFIRAIGGQLWRRALDDGEVPLEFLFSGTVFYSGDDGALQTMRISWDAEAEWCKRLKMLDLGATS